MYSESRSLNLVSKGCDPFDQRYIPVRPVPLDKGNDLEECPVPLSDWTCLSRFSEGRPNRKVRFHLAAFPFSATIGNECLTSFK